MWSYYIQGGGLRDKGGGLIKGRWEGGLTIGVDFINIHLTMMIFSFS